MLASLPRISAAACLLSAFFALAPELFGGGAGRGSPATPSSNATCITGVIPTSMRKMLKSFGSPGQGCQSCLRLRITDCHASTFAVTALWQSRPSAKPTAQTCPAGPLAEPWPGILIPSCDLWVKDIQNRPPFDPLRLATPRRAQ